MDQVQRILYAMLDVAADVGWLDTTLNVIDVLRHLVQAGGFPGKGASDERIQLGLNEAELRRLKSAKLKTLRQMASGKPSSLSGLARKKMALIPICRLSAKVLGDQLKITITVQGGRGKRLSSPMVKPGSAGWFLILADEDELLSIKRISLPSRETRLSVPLTEAMKVSTCLLVSDSYFGLDSCVRL